MKSFFVLFVVLHCLVLGSVQVQVASAGYLPEYYNLRGGTFYGSFSSPLYYQYRYGHPYGYTPRVHATTDSYTPKAIPAQLPVSKPFDIEIMKPMSQLPERKTVPLYIVPQSSLHVFPHIQKIPAQPVTTTTTFFQRFQYEQYMTDPSHLPAIEIPLEEPIVVGTVSSDVLAPSGFNVVLKGQFGNSIPFPIYTAALLAPVPTGTIVSKDTPVILTTIYAIPSLPYEPSYYPILAQFPAKMIGASKGSKLAQSVKNTFISTSTGATTNVISSAPMHISTARPRPIPARLPVVAIAPERPFVSYPSGGGGGAGNQFISAYPDTSYPTAIPAPPTSVFQDHRVDPLRDEGGFEQFVGGDAVSISGTSPDFTPRPFVNDKESPYLRELREQSIRSQIAELQQLLHTLAATRNQIGTNYAKK